MSGLKKIKHKAGLTLAILIFLIIVASTASAWVLNDALGINRQQVMSIQQCLNLMGYNSGPADGLWGPKTDAAARGWLAKHNLINTDVDMAYQRFITACQATQSRQNKQQHQSSSSLQPTLRYGMTKGEVRNIVGAPTTVTGEEPNVFWWYYASDSEIYLLQFQHGIYVDTGQTTLEELNTLSPQSSTQQPLWNAHQKIPRDKY